MLMFAKLHLWLAGLRDREEGQALVEYALILALVSVVAIALLEAIGTNIQTVLTDVRDALAGRKLENGAGTASAGHAPRLEVLCHANHREFAIEKDGVDGEAHEPGMDGPHRAEEKSLARTELPAPEKAF